MTKRHIQKLPVIISCLYILSGCTSEEKVPHGTEVITAMSTPPNKEYNTTEQPVEKGSEDTYLQQCLNDAELLLRTNKKYTNEVTSLYKTIDSAKHYASVSSKVSTSVSMTVTPLYEFRVHDICNNISSLVIKEIKTESGTRNN
ncbi:TPA: hypothetical protein ACOEAK_004411 [Enterobacter ludwigii]|uniref:hypothetical protein n=1 Tax=Enterobacter sp. BIDMC 26 TaxID=1329838 RepID=UPI0012DEA1C2|nr:hypothetical protein [Enterobacter sp. BIDMC 26]